MGSVGDELLVARLRADESRRWRRGASMASWAAPKWAQPRDRGTPRITKTGKGDAGNTPGRRRRRRRASSSTQSRRRPPRRRAGAASTRPRGAARPTARLRSRGSASVASGGSPRHAQSAARTSKEQKDTASEPGSAATTSTRRSDRSAARLLRGEERRHASSPLRTRPRTASETKTGPLHAAPSPPAGSTPGPQLIQRPARVSAGSRHWMPRRWRRCPSWAASSSTRPCAR